MISGTTTTTTMLLSPRVYAQENNSADTGTVGGTASLPTLSLDYGTNGRTFEPVNVRYIVQSGTLMNDTNFKFFSDEWHSLAHGVILQAQPSANPNDMAVKLVKVLNPVERGHQDFKDMKFSNIIITLPFASSDNGEHRNFLVTNDVPSGYYVINVLGRYDNQQLAVVYTGKVFIPAAAGPANIDNEHSSQSGPGQQERTCGGNQTFDRVSGDCVTNRGGGGPRDITSGPCSAGQVRTQRMSADYRLQRGPCVPIHTSSQCSAGQEWNLVEGRCRAPPAISCPDGQARADLSCVPIPPFDANCDPGQERTLRGCEPSSNPCTSGQFRYTNGRCLPLPSSQPCDTGSQRSIFNSCLAPLTTCPSDQFRYGISCYPPRPDPCPDGQERYADGLCEAVAGESNEQPQTIGPECTTDPMTGATICNPTAPPTATSAPSPQDRSGTSNGQDRGGQGAPSEGGGVDGGGGTPSEGGGGGGGGGPVDGGDGGGDCKGDKCGDGADDNGGGGPSNNDEGVGGGGDNGGSGGPSDGGEGGGGK